MEIMGFSSKWIQLVMECVRSVSYSIVVNGKACGNITPSRGLRQGDPLSPFLFLLCAEGLSCKIRQAGEEGNLKGIAIARKSPRVSHLFFTDDCLLFCRTKSSDCLKMVAIMKDYELVSGQVINLDKSGLIFSRNTREEDKAEVVRILNISRILEKDKYLGLPLMIGRSKQMEFRYIQERIWARIKGWGRRLLSKAGKAVLIQAIVQAIPLYVMNCFKLPKNLIHDIHRVVAGYWWGDENGKRKIHWKRWEGVCVSKLDGGLGFKDFESFNLAMLAKQWWRIIHSPQSLSFKVLKGRYFYYDDPMKIL